MATIRRGTTATGHLIWTVPQTIVLTSMPLKGQPPPVSAVQPVPRALSFGAYCFNGQHMTGLKSNCELRVVQGDPVLFVYQGSTRIYSYVAGNPDGSLPALEQAIEGAKVHGLPIIAYWPRSLQINGTPLPKGADLIGVELYMQEPTLTAWEKRCRNSLQRVPKSAALCQAYTSNASLTKDLISLVPPYSDLLNDFPSIRACLLFSGAGRPTGLQDHPEVVPYWRVIADSVKTPPLPVEPPVPVPIPNHKDVMVRARAKYNAMPAGFKRGYTITNEGAWELRAEGAGMFFKSSGDRYNDRSCDTIIYQHRDGDPPGKGQTFDVLGDAEGAARPQWESTKNPATGATGFGDISKWRAPVDPGGEPEPPQPPSTDLKAVLRDVRGDFVTIKMQASDIMEQCDESIAKIDVALD